MLQLVASVGILLSGFGLASAEESPQYNRDVRPILAEYCFACHGADSAARKADLRLDQREAAIEFGAITPSAPDESELLARITSDDADLVMPPPETKKTLSAEQKEILRRWIASGAEYQPHWSFIPPARPQLPAVTNQAWGNNPIDRFVLAKLETQGLAPAAEADARTLFRRLHLDITGLPPSPDDAAAFVKDYQQRKDEALSDWIDRLMESTAWGEHRARYWLDAARYGDTHGLHFDNYREMWPYRDWVIRAFNANQPFDQFTVEQIAGDLLEDPSDDQLIATGFQRCNITTNEGGTIDEENLANYAVDRVQTFGWVYLGLTTNCSQCHNHKFDPFTQKDFYSLAAYFRNTTQQAKDGNTKEGRGPILVIPPQEDRPRWEVLPKEIAAATAKRDSRKKQARQDFDKWLATAKPEAIGDGPSADLLVHARLDEGAGKEAAAAGEGSPTIEATGEITWEKGGVFGPAPVIQAGATFELGDQGDFEIDQPFSYGAWVKPASADASAAIVARMDEKTAHRGWDLWQNGQSFSVHLIDSWPNNGIKVTTRRRVVRPGKWQHVLATYDGSGSPDGIHIYVDGRDEQLRVENKTLKPKATIHADTPLRIGQRSEGAVLAGAAVQDVRVYGRRLSEAEVSDLANYSTLRKHLATPADKRTPQQTTALFDHYLLTRDAEYPALEHKLAELETERHAIQARSAVTHIQEEKPTPAMAHVLMRGEYDRPAEEVAAATPESLHPMPQGAPNNRLGLAQWLVDPANPLTARVTVNRFWQQVFGRGIVATPEDFGVMGAPPTHPELLDWLAVDFRESGWDVKRFFKQMLMSAAYRQAAVVTPEKLEQDRDNALLSRGPRFRMDAEMVRDAALAASGLLSSKMYGPSVKPYQPEAIWDIVGLPGGDTRTYVQDHGEDLYRRTVYSFWKRMAPPPNLDAFNAPSREVCTVSRERTNTPLQALVTLNDPQFVEASRHLAERALLAAGDDDAKVVEFIALHVLGRGAEKRELAVLLADQKEFLAYYESKTDDAEALVSVGESKVDKTLDAAELAAWTMVASEVMNLDEALNK
ncbi:MAG: DUF1553 domain-containing protein [Pirellulaceae bacterium]